MITKNANFANYEIGESRFVNFKDGKDEVKLEKYDSDGVYMTIDNGSMDSGSLSLSLDNFKEFIKRCQWIIEEKGKAK